LTFCVYSHIINVPAKKVRLDFLGSARGPKTEERGGRDEISASWRFTYREMCK
jgi:hypothetical protein